MSSLFLRLFVIGCVMSVVMSFPQERQQTLVQRNGNPRSNRGFQIQNGKLSTARGFGKRGGEIGFGTIPQSPAVGSGFSLETIFPPNFDTRSSYPSSWLVDEIQANPDTARYIVDKFLDENGDGELTAEELFRRNFF